MLMETKPRQPESDYRIASPEPLKGDWLAGEEI
jgi:hypothetical protein